MVQCARQLVDTTSPPQNQYCLSPEIIQALNQMGYAEAAEHVYGVSYDEWKKRHQQKATDDQMKQYQASTHLHAQHDPTMMEKRVTPSNVCCQDVDENDASVKQPPPLQQKPPPSDDRQVPRFTPPPIPFQYLPDPLHVAVLTVSDRASRGAYATGDLSGPAVVEAVQGLLPDHAMQVTTVIVPDDAQRIQAQLNAWKDQVHFVLTTGGTGFSARDVTPEATKQVLDTELPGFMTFVTTECSRMQPLSSLSRGTAGILGSSTVVVNLPGNPKGMQEMIPIVLPLVLHMVVELQE